MVARRRRSFEAIERDARAVELRRHHLTYKQIAEQLGFKSVGSCYESVQRGLLDAIREPADEVRNMELMRLDGYGRSAERVMGTIHYVTGSSGKVSLHPKTGEPLVDDEPVLRSIKTLLDIQRRRAALLGLDAPARHEVTHVDDTVNLEIARLVGELAAGGQGPAASHPEVFGVAVEGESGAATP